MKNIVLSFKNGLGNFILLTPCIEVLKSMNYDVDILLNTPKDDIRYTAFEDIISNYNGIGFYKEEKQYDVGFYVWGEGERQLPNVNVKDWKITKESNNPIQYFLTGKHEVELNMTIVKHLGYEGEIPDTVCPTKKMDMSGWNEKLISICIHIGSRPENHWKKKRWSSENWIELFKICEKQKYNLHLFYSRWEKDDVDYIRSKILNTEIKINFNSYKNNSITEIAFIIKQCDLMISTDSGPMHIANAVGIPVIQLFGCTLSSKNSCWNKDDNTIILKNETLECSPCIYTDRFNKCTDNICMKSIKPEEVYHNVEKILEKKLAIC